MIAIDFDALAAELGVANNFDFQQAMLRVWNKAWSDGYHKGAKQSDQMWMNAIDHKKDEWRTEAPIPKREIGDEDEWRTEASYAMTEYLSLKGEM